MANFTTDRIRNVTIISHSGAGKTTLNEALLFTAGAVKRLGRVDEGNAVADYEPEEIERKISIVPALCHCVWENTRINLVDTPGYADFIADAIYSLWVTEAALLVVDAVAGVEVHTEKMYATARTLGKPVVAVVNKMDKANANFAQAVASMSERLVGCKPVPLYLPIGAAEDFTGVIDLLSNTALLGEGAEVKRTEVPPEFAEAVDEARMTLIEDIASSDDQLMERYLEEEELSPEDLRKALGQAILAGELLPVIPAGAFSAIGATAILDTIVEALPSPAGRAWPGVDNSGNEITRLCDASEPTAAVIFKTVGDPYVGRISYIRVVSGVVTADSIAMCAQTNEREKLSGLSSVQGKATESVPDLVAGDLGCVTKLNSALTGHTLCDPKAFLQLTLPSIPESMYAASARAAAKADEDKLSIAMSRYAEEDISFHAERNTETGEMVVTGMGAMHLQIAVERIKRKFGAEIELGTPKIPYRETFKTSVRVQGRHKKQTGGRGQFGDVWIRVDPAPRGSGLEFVDEVKGGAVPRNFIPAVEKGVRDAASRGALAGFPVVDIRVTLDDGSSHPVDSSDIAFRTAGRIALDNAMAQAQMALLEPIMDIEVVTPEEQVGDVMSDLNGRRGRVLGMEPRGSMTVVNAQVPLGELATFEADLRSMTQGRASYSQRFSHYEELPGHLAERLIAQTKDAEKG
ncbi:MAG: elongation factor G [Candidatus Zipacnadales bacterium]